MEIQFEPCGTLRMVKTQEITILGRKDRTLPRRLMEEAVPEDPAKGQRNSKDEMVRLLDEYYFDPRVGPQNLLTESKMLREFRHGKVHSRYIKAKLPGKSSVEIY